MESLELTPEEVRDLAEMVQIANKALISATAGEDRDPLGSRPRRERVAKIMAKLDAYSRRVAVGFI